MILKTKADLLQKVYKLVGRPTKRDADVNHAQPVIDLVCLT
jgi:hypothetical protein